MVTAPESTEVSFVIYERQRLTLPVSYPVVLLPISSIKAEVILGVCS